MTAAELPRYAPFPMMLPADLWHFASIAAAYAVFTLLLGGILQLHRSGQAWLKALVFLIAEAALGVLYVVWAGLWTPSSGLGAFFTKAALILAALVVAVGVAGAWYRGALPKAALWIALGHVIATPILFSNARAAVYWYNVDRFLTHHWFVVDQSVYRLTLDRRSQEASIVRIVEPNQAEDGYLFGAEYERTAPGVFVIRGSRTTFSDTERQVEPLRYRIERDSLYGFERTQNGVALRDHAGGA